MSKSASPTSKSVGTTDAHPQERTARELLTQSRPLFLGIGGEDGAHYWDLYEFAVAVVASEGRAEKVQLAETPYETLAGWCEYTQDERGWAVGPHVGGSLVGDLARRLNA